MRIVVIPTCGGVTDLCVPVGNILGLSAEDLARLWLDAYAPLIADPDCQAECVKVTAYNPHQGFIVPDCGRPLALLEGAATGHSYVLFLNFSGDVPQVMCYQVTPYSVEISLDATDFTPVP